MATTAYTYSPIPTPPSANAAAFEGFGKQVEGFNPAEMNEEGLKEIIDMLYKVGLSCLCLSLLDTLSLIAGHYHQGGTHRCREGKVK